MTTAHFRRGALARLAPALLVMACAVTAQARTWKSADGKHTIEGELAGYDAPTAMIQIDSGDRKVSVKLADLSAYDIAYLREIGAPIPAEGAATAAASPAAKGPAAERSLSEVDLKQEMFMPYPTAEGRNGSKPWLVRNLGPVGIGINLVRPGMTMQIHNVEPGSPADKTGKLKQGQIIERINGRVLDKLDPRILLGDLITEAEATDGKIVLEIKDAGKVTVEIPVMGRYSNTWPLDCPKSDKIVRNLADVLAKQEKPSWGSVLFMLSTGEEKDLQVVKRWMKGIETIGAMNWEKGYKGPGLCEYYLRTGDESVLPVIKKMTEELRVHMYSGGWSGRGASAAFTYSTGTGQVHASGVHCMTFLLMAKLCGVEVDDYMFNQTWNQFYRFAGHGNVAYGNGRPEGGFRDNGKSSGLACGLSAAAMVDPAGENSFYARARDNTAMKAFYATNWFHAAHTGGGMGEIWHHAAMNIVREKRPASYRSYMDTRRWVMDLSRRFDGSIGIAGMDDRYDRSATEDEKSWGTYFALTYTLPRKQLQLFGAPRSQWAKSMPLPRPWGNEADDAYHSIEPIAGGPLTPDMLLNERVQTDASLAVLKRLEGPDCTQQDLVKYIHHPEYGLREAAMRQVVLQGKDEMVLPLLKSSDTRLRQCGLLAITGMFKGSALPDNKLTDAMFDEVEKMVVNNDEAWWTTLYAIEALARADKERIGRQRDRLIEFLSYNSTYLQAAATITLTQIATEPEHYETVLPYLLTQTAGFRVDSASMQSALALQKALAAAPKKVQDFAKPQLQEIFSNLPGVLAEPNTGAVMNRASNTIRGRIGSILQVIPGGEDFVRTLPKTTLQSHISGDDRDCYVYSGKFTPNKKLVGTWLWAVWPAANKPGEIDDRIKGYAKNFNGTVNGSKDTLKLLDQGMVKRSKYYSGYFWTDGMLVGINEDQALKMEVRTVGGHDWLIVERGGFNTEPANEEEATAKVPADYHCGYHIYVRAAEAPKKKK